ncbi:dihydrolipoyl dehydrogenase [uncultured Methylibium sp.]|uniref:dihydrolipoyl dehydrogenase n=1 Tax=uncultured Methylibium sp. TaxID=381093 RepID=UPI0025E24850|nr:dihydrolipoyl dehydrogenase [uncultured Methylibium sp.]
MPTRQVDVAILGAGSAGLSAWRAARQHTPQVLMIDPGPWGTTCARVGCMPSKLLIAAAEAAHAARHAHRFGIDVQGIQVDGARVMDRVRSERDRFVGFVLEDMQPLEPGHLLRGRARFTGPNELHVDTPDGALRVRAGRFVIATGSRPEVPAAWRTALGERLIVNDDVFDWTELPRSVAVVGAGVIGLELANALHRLGVRVRLLARGSRIGPLTDPVLAAQAVRIFETQLPLQREATFFHLQRDGDAVDLHWRTPQGEERERFDFLLAAIGRRPNIDDIGLEHLGLPADALDDDGVPRHDPATGRIGDSHVFIAGDVADDKPLLHEAADEGHIAGDNAGRWPDVQPQPRRTPLAVVFSEPQIMLAGRSHRELSDARVLFATGHVSFENQGRSRVIGRNVGALHVYADCGTRRLLGAEMIGPAAEHLGHLLAWSIGHGATVDDALAQPFYHPVIEEGLRTALRELRKALDARPPCEGCTPGE